MSNAWLIGYLVLLIVLISGMYLYGKRRLINEISRKDSAIDELNTLQKQQNFFIQKMIHEMNTPLSAIELNLSVLSKECPNNRNLDMIKGSARVLATIYEDIAFVARKDKMCHLPEWIDLGEFIADRILYFDAMTVVKEMLVEIDIDEGYSVHMSPTELQRVVDNNLSNAIKYTMQKGQIISIIISYQEEALYLTFKDNGIGMTEEDLEKLFESYYRGHSDQHGLGLGMSIVKDICDDYKISVNVKSSRGEGSSFIYRFSEEMVRQTLVKQ